MSTLVSGELGAGPSAALQSAPGHDELDQPDDLGAPAADQARWREAVQLRVLRRGRWVIIWSAHKREFQARPTFTVRSVVAIAATTEDLIAQMDAIEDRHTRAWRRRQRTQAAGM